MYVMYEIDEGGKTGTVVATSSDSGSEAVWKDGFWVDVIPEAATSAGRVPRLKVNLETMELYYIYVDGTGQTTNDYNTQIKELRRDVDLLKKAFDDLMMGGL